VLECSNSRLVEPGVRVHAHVDRRSNPLNPGGTVDHSQEHHITPYYTTGWKVYHKRRNLLIRETTTLRLYLHETQEEGTGLPALAI
jgi:hypothetical protein